MWIRGLLWFFFSNTLITIFPQSCPQPKDGFINVHVVPHTHLDPGWLKTVDQYFWGSKRSITPAAVNLVLDTVMQELLANSERKFM